MELTPEWVAIILTLMGMSGGAGVWLQKRREQARAALPILRPQWGVPAKRGYAVSVLVVNRLKEDLLISKAECRSSFTLVESKDYDPTKGTVEFTYTPSASPMDLVWTVAAESEGEMTFRIDGAETERWLRLTMSPSARTLWRKRMIVRDSQLL